MSKKAPLSRRVRRRLDYELRKMNKNPASCAVNPEKDFTRHGRIGPGDVVKAFMLFGSESQWNELDNLGFEYTDSAFCQSKDKVDPECVVRLLKSMNKFFTSELAESGPRLIAFDGTDFCLPAEKVPIEHTSVKNGRRYALSLYMSAPRMTKELPHLRHLQS